MHCETRGDLFNFTCSTFNIIQQNFEKARA